MAISRLRSGGRFEGAVMAPPARCAYQGQAARGAEAVRARRSDRFRRGRAYHKCESQPSW
jgi:hypothetical protein